MSLTSVPSLNVDVTILDSWPFVENILRKVRVHRLDELLERASKSEMLLLMSEMNLGEVFYLVAKHKGDTELAESVLATILRLPIQIVPVATGMVLRAARLKAERQLSYADCFGALLAIDNHAPMLKGDPDFLKLEADGLIRVDWVGR
jgi:predicted nucleic acid-binding protein